MSATNTSRRAKISEFLGKQTKIYWIATFICVVGGLLSIILGALSTAATLPPDTTACKGIHISKVEGTKVTLKIDGQETQYDFDKAINAKECTKYFYASWILAIFAILGGIVMFVTVK